MKTPSFSHMGGKARLRGWLVQHFPDKGGVYLEPFAGKGNVYFKARQELRFEQWVLADLDVRFLYSLTKANLMELPATVSKEEFGYWKTRDCHVSRLIEPRVTFGGKGYRHGYNGTCGTHVGYNGILYRRICQQARMLLSDAQVAEQPWQDSLSNLNDLDFVYLDPPYYGTKAAYKNVDHEELVQTLNEARFRWALSGYQNPLYDTRLEFKCRFEYERNSEIKSSNSRGREPVIEHLWTNYEL